MPTYGINGTTLNLEHIQLKCKNASEWTATDVLLAGEIGVEIDTHKAKIGDGSTAWTALSYSADPTVQGVVDTLTSKMATAESTLILPYPPRYSLSIHVSLSSISQLP